MSVPAHNLQLSADEYLRLEEASDIRHEYVSGRIFAMAGATQAHDVIVTNLTILVGSKIRGTGCRIFSSDMKIKVEATKSFYYPDLIVSCEIYSAKSVFAKAPCLIIEVLSPSTSDIDRREKLLSYRTLASLNEYVIFYQEQRRVELYKRTAEDWAFYAYEGHEHFVLMPTLAVEISLSLDEIYEGVI